MSTKTLPQTTKGLPLGTPVWATFEGDEDYRYIAYIWYDGEVKRKADGISETPKTVRRVMSRVWDEDMLYQATLVCWYALDEIGYLDELVPDINDPDWGTVPSDDPHPWAQMYGVWGSFCARVEDGWEPFSHNSKAVATYKAAGGLVTR